MRLPCIHCPAQSPSGCGCSPLLPLLGFVLNGLLSLLPAAHIGPADPDMGHGAHDHAHHGDHAAAHSGRRKSWGSGDDHHPTAIHKYAGLVSFIGPAVLGASFVLAAMMFFAMRGANMHTPFIQTYFSWMPSWRSERERGVPARPAVHADGAHHHRCWNAHSPVQRWIHANRPGISAVLRLSQPVRVLHARARARRQLSGSVRWVGRRRTLLVLVDRVLVLGEGERGRWQEGVHRQPHR